MQGLILKLYLEAKTVLLNRTDGQGMSEYAVTVALIALGCIAGEAAIATSINRVFEGIGTIIINGVIQ